MAEPAFAFVELLKLVAALGVTIGLFYALALFMKRMQVGTGKSGNMINVLAALPLGGKEKLWVVEIAGEKLVVGTSPGQVNCLHVLKHDAAGVVDLAQETSAAMPASFPRKRESSLEPDDTQVGLDSRFRGNDAEKAPRNPADLFSALLQNFRGGHNP